MSKFTFLLYGEPGTGKSTSVVTLLKPSNLVLNPNLKLRFLCTDPNALLGIEEGITRHGIKLKEGQLLTQVVKVSNKQGTTSKDRAEEFFTNFMQLDDSLALKVKTTPTERLKRCLFVRILQGLAAFKGIDMCTKEEVNCGDFLAWKDDVVFVIDGLTAITESIVDVILGKRILTGLTDYNLFLQIMQRQFILPLTVQGECSVVLLAHAQLGLDPTTKQPKVKQGDPEKELIRQYYPKTFGQQLNTLLSSYFQETVFSYVDKLSGNYYWAGRKNGVFTSTRKIPKEVQLKQDFSLYNIISN